MTTPVFDDVDDLVQGAVKFLAAQPDIRAVLSAEASGAPWLFQHTLWATMEGTGGTAAVLSTTSGWAAANTYNTMRFPRLLLDLWADPIRDPMHNITNPGETFRRMEQVFRAFDAHLHRPANPAAMWGSVRVIACTRIAEPSMFTVSDGDGLVRSQIFYAVTQA